MVSLYTYLDSDTHRSIAARIIVRRLMHRNCTRPSAAVVFVSLYRSLGLAGEQLQCDFVYYQETFVHCFLFYVSGTWDIITLYDYCSRCGSMFL
jgi:hypothetical protein